MQIKAQLNGLRMAPRKVRAVTNLVKGKDVANALNQMEFLMKRPILPLIKLLKSAIANGENNLNMVKENLYIKEFLVDEGIKLKRYMPRAQGRAGEIQKKTSKVHIVLDERVTGLKRSADHPAAEIVPAFGKQEHASAFQQKSNIGSGKLGAGTAKKHEVETEIGKKSEGSIARRLFRRKVI